MGTKKIMKKKKANKLCVCSLFFFFCFVPIYFDVILLFFFSVSISSNFSRFSFYFDNPLKDYQATESSLAGRSILLVTIIFVVDAAHTMFISAKNKLTYFI